MNLQQTNNSFNHAITGGSEYGWNCFPYARFLDYASEYADVTVIYSTVTQEIYQADVSIKPVKHNIWPSEKKPYRWTNPSYNDAYLKEAKERNVDPAQAWDDVNFVQLEVEEDFLTKATAMFNGEDFDTRIQIPLTLNKDELHELMVLAHERDITLNKMVEIVLQEAIDRHQNDVSVR